MGKPYGFSNWYLNQKKKKGKYSKTSVGIYVRNIRVILNEAIGRKVIEKDAMPISKDKYRIPGSSKRKFALKSADVSTIASAKIEPGSLREKCRDYFVFSYFAQGMNLADMARLRYEDIDSEKLSYIRAKTALKKLEEPEFITVPLLPELGKIIDKWGNKPALPATYVFPILKPEMSPVDEFQAIRATLKTVNTYIKKIASVHEIEGNVSFYVARHSYATILKNAGVSAQAISENPGHSSTKVTQDFLANFEIEEKVKQSEYLRPKKI